MFAELFGWVEEHPGLLSAAFGGSLLLLVGTALVLPWLVTRMPADYFLNGKGRDWSRTHPALRVTFHVAKNLIGGLLLMAGVAMLVLPGQGLLTILVAITLLDFPGKRRLELRIARQRQVSRVIRWLRRRAGQPPLIYPEDDGGGSKGE